MKLASEAMGRGSQATNRNFDALNDPSSGFEADPRAASGPCQASIVPFIGNEAAFIAYETAIIAY